MVDGTCRLGRKLPVCKVRTISRLSTGGIAKVPLSPLQYTQQHHRPMLLPFSETRIATQFRLKETFYFNDDTSQSTYRTVTRLISKPSYVNITGRTLTEWQEHNPNITKITHTYTPIVTKETNIEHFKLANTIHSDAGQLFLSQLS